MSDFDHTGPMCASIGHYVATITVAFCPHRQGWVVHVRAGDDRDDTSWDMRTIEFGPFDGANDVLARAQSELASLVRVGSAAWLAGQREPGSETTDSR